MNEQKKYEVIKKLKETNGNKKRAAAQLGCTLRHVNRMLKGYETYGKDFFSHGNKGRRPASAISDESIHVSEGTVRNLLLSHNILSPLAWKRTRRRLADSLKTQKDTATSKKEKERLQAAIVAAQDAHPTRSRCVHAGEMIQMDASVHLWFGETKTHLHAAIDDATGSIVGAYFDAQETLHGYYHVFRQIL